MQASDYAFLVVGFLTVGERSDAGVARAVKDGLARAASAPAVFAGTLVLTFVVAARPALTVRDAMGPQLDASGPAWIHGGGPLLLKPCVTRAGSQPWLTDLPAAVTWILFLSFLSGGILDRYARNRAIRGRGFFGACAAHFPPMLRLGIVAFLIHAAISRWLTPRLTGNAYADTGVLAALFGVNLLLTYARVRIVVEDRRSAIGALFGAGRFIRRNPAAAGLHLFSSLLATANVWLVTLSLVGGSPLGSAAGWVFGAVQAFLILASLAAATALFQARLAHASYTAAPPIEWPDSPAAEAIANLARPAVP